MAGGDFNAAVNAKVEGGKVNLFGAGQANIQHVDARITQAVSQRQLQRFAGQAYVTAQHDRLRFQVFTVGAANTPGDVFIQLFAKLAANVVGFKTG